LLPEITGAIDLSEIHYLKRLAGASLSNQDEGLMGVDWLKSGFVIYKSYQRIWKRLPSKGWISSLQI